LATLFIRVETENDGLQVCSALAACQCRQVENILVPLNITSPMNHPPEQPDKPQDHVTDRPDDGGINAESEKQDANPEQPISDHRPLLHPCGPNHDADRESGHKENKKPKVGRLPSGIFFPHKRAYLDAKQAGLRRRSRLIPWGSGG
jgi:hypothetical protein